MASKTVENPFILADSERGCFFVVEWTKSNVISAALSEWDIFGNNAKDIMTVADFFDGFL